MANSRPKDPLQHMLAYMRKQKEEHSDELAIGRWSGEAQARELVGRIKALADLESEMKKYLGPHSQYLEQDLTP